MKNPSTPPLFPKELGVAKKVLDFKTKPNLSISEKNSQLKNIFDHQENLRFVFHPPLLEASKHNKLCTLHLLLNLKLSTAFFFV